LTILAIAGFATIAIFAAVVLKYNQGKKAGADILSPVFTLAPATDIKLGSTVSADGLIACPWHRWPVKANVTPGKGSQSEGNAAIKFSGLGWGSWKWKVSAKLQPYQNGRIEEGRIEIELNNPASSDKQRSLVAAISPFESAPLDIGSSQELAVAGSMIKKIISNKLLFILAGIVIGVIIIFLFLMFRRNRKNNYQRAIPAWDVALAEFGKLRIELKGGRLSTDICISKLTDIIRNYLEKRFSLHAPTQTTAEFLEDLKRENSPLGNENRSFLKEFMTAADLVKFAKLPADEAVIENAIIKAEVLVITTRPVESGQQVSGVREKHGNINNIV